MGWYYLSNLRGDKIYGIVRCNNIMEDFYQNELSNKPIFHGDVKGSGILHKYIPANIKKFLFRKGLI